MSIIEAYFLTIAPIPPSLNQIVESLSIGKKKRSVRRNPCRGAADRRPYRSQETKMRHSLVVKNSRHRELLRCLYDAGSINLARSDEVYISRKDKKVSWVLDLRRPLLRSESLASTAEVMCALLREAGASQIAGHGMGAAPLIAGVVAQGKGINGLLLRDHPKRRGLIRPVEGDLDPQKPVVMLDDIVNSGSSMVLLVKALREVGYEVRQAFCLFRYTWGAGARRLQKLGVELHALADLQHQKRWTRRYVERRLEMALGKGES